jgi:hypothetical protein
MGFLHVVRSEAAGCDQHRIGRTAEIAKNRSLMRPPGTPLAKIRSRDTKALA